MPDEHRNWADLHARGQGIGSEATDLGTPMLSSDPDLMTLPPKDTWCHLGADQLDRLDHASMIVDRAFDSRAYLVGSCLERPDWRDVDVRVVLDDDEYDALFPGDGHERTQPMWSLLCASISEYLSRLTDLPIDFQIQRRTQANEQHDGRRVPLGLFVTGR